MNEELIFSDNMEYILHWINENYNKEMTVNELAQRLYVSPATFSRKFQKATQQKFTDYLNRLRIGHAMADLANTNKNITEIAMNHGFGNVSVFSKIFKQYEQTTPSAYRRAHSHTVSARKAEPENISLSLTPSANFAVPYSKIWNFAIDLGDAENLLFSNMQQQIISLRNTLGFQYIRMCNIFSENIFSVPFTSHSLTNYEKLDIITDFLLQNHLKPWIDFGKGKETFARDIINALPLTKSSGITEFDEKYDILENLMIHWAARYGSEQVSQWNFELWFDDQDVNDNDIDQYIRIFLHFYTIIKSYAPKAKFGTMGKAIPTSVDFVERVLTRWPSGSNLPDFLSIFAFPYEFPLPDNLPHRSHRIQFTQSVFALTKSILTKYHKENIPVYITEWNITVSERNAINDSCIRAAYMLQNMEGTITQTHPVICHILSDISSSLPNDRSLIYGGSGILSKNGLYKPAYYALYFMNKMPGYCIAHGNGYIITTDRRSRFDLLLFNVCPLPDDYFKKKEYEITADIVLNTLSDGQPRLHFSVDIETGTHPRYYQKKQCSLIPGESDLQGKLKDFGTFAELDADDLEYLKAASRPGQHMELIDSFNQKLHIDCDLEPFAITYISLQPMNTSI